jgi:peptidoglycan/xylan/chitin deacetylase (PgdA/CDA1 family)
MFACLFRLLSLIFPSLEWTVPTTEKIIYLTFDDGPIPIVTDFVLDQLQKYNASATFFCVGDNVHKHPEVFKRIIDEGHGVGNHTFNHLNGWKNRNVDYFKNIKIADEAMKDEGLSITQKMLFRPPYGKITPSQISYLKSKYRIIMWDILTGDYDPTLTSEKCLERAMAAKPGSIVIFHDSHKAEPNMRFALPKFLEHYTQRGFTFKSL